MRIPKIKRPRRGVILLALSSITLSGLMVAGKFKDVFKPAMETENAQVRIIRVLENGYGWSREEAKKAVKGITDELSIQAAATIHRNTGFILDGLERYYRDLLIRTERR